MAVISGEEYLGKKPPKATVAEVEIGTTVEKPVVKTAVKKVEPTIAAKSGVEKANNRIVAVVEPQDGKEKKRIKTIIFYKRCVREEIWHVFTEKYGYTFFIHEKKTLAVGAAKEKVKLKANVKADDMNDINKKYLELGYQKIMDEMREVQE